MKKSGFSPRVAVLLVALVFILVSLSIILSAYDEKPVDRGAAGAAGAGPGAYSTSALGYAALYDLLQGLGWKVTKSVSPGKVAYDDLLVLAEPSEKHLSEFRQALRSLPEKTLVVLPKWTGTPQFGRPRWVEDVELVPRTRVKAIVEQVADYADCEVVRESWPTQWRMNELGVEPAGSGTLQRIRFGTLRPLVADDSGVLLGEIERDDEIIWILSDPDVMSNHGLGDNAEFMLALFTLLSDGERGAPVAFLESLHGYRETTYSVLRLLFDFPFVVATILAVLTALMLVWAGVERFGQPDRAPRDAGFGKERLIDNSARLMEYSGHQRFVLVRYVRLTIRAAAAALHAPSGYNEEKTVAWLDRVGRARGLKTTCAEILARVESIRAGDGEIAGLSRCARDAHNWKNELLGSFPAERRKAAV